MSHETVWEPNGVYWKLDGELTSTELFEFSQELVAGGSTFKRLKYFLVDCLAVNKYTDDSDDAELTAVQSDGLTRYNKRLLGVFVYDTPVLEALIKGYIANMAAKESPWQFATFDNLEDARNWIESMTY